MRYRLANVHDLMASQGKYYRSCYVGFIRKYDKESESQTNAGPENIALVNVADELKRGLASNQIYHLSTVLGELLSFLEIL